MTGGLRRPRLSPSFHHRLRVAPEIFYRWGGAVAAGEFAKGTRGVGRREGLSGLCTDDRFVGPVERPLQARPGIVIACRSGSPAPSPRGPALPLGRFV